MKVDRDPRRPVRHLEWRVRLMGVGAVLALAGIALDAGWMVNVAIGVLVVGFLLRFVPGEDAAASVGGERDDGDDGRSDAEGERPPAP